MMFCPKCGAQNGEESAFCANCGAPLNNAPSAPQQPSAGGQGYYQPQGYNQAPQGYNQASQGYNQQPQPGYYPAQGYGQPVQRKSKSAVIAIVIVAVVVVLGVVAFFVFRGIGNPLMGTWISSDYGYDISITFKWNGVVEGEFDGELDRSTYKVKGETLTITDSDGAVYDYTYEIMKENGKTVLSLYSSGTTLTLYKK